MIILNLHGPFESGKDTIAEFLHQEFGALVVPYSEPVRRGLWALDPIISIPTELRSTVGTSPTGKTGEYLRDVEFVNLKFIMAHYGWEWAKRNLPEVRRLYQRYGTEAGWHMHGRDCWTKLHGEKILKHAWPDDQARIAVSPDLRFPHEHAHGKALAEQIQRSAYARQDSIAIARYACWVVDRPDRRPTQNDTHESEAWHPPAEDVICTIVNDGTLADLYMKVRRALLKTVLHIATPARSSTRQHHNEALYKRNAVDLEAAAHGA